MSHPIPGHDYEHKEERDIMYHVKKTAMAKSMGRHQAKVGKQHKGLYPGSISDTVEKIRRSIKKHK